MFVPNTSHLEDFLGAWSQLLSPEKLERLKQSRGYAFYQRVFCKIKEPDFGVLYSEKYSAPNCPVNCLAGALVWQHLHNWSCEELMSQIEFNVETRVAIGLKDLESRPFTERTLFNFKKRLAWHKQHHGANLLEGVFDGLTASQIKELGVKTSIQRLDSALVDSNIQSYSRLSLLAEILRRLYKTLSETDQQKYLAWFTPYLKGGEKYVYGLKGSEYGAELEALTAVYYGLGQALGEHYKEQAVFQAFERVYSEHFKEAGPEAGFPLALRPVEELGSGVLQSPDDTEATFKSKRKEPHRGFAVMAAETCHPDNELNLVTKIAVEANNTDDSAMLENKLDEMAQATPALEELHHDGGFGSERLDIKAAGHGIALIQTAIKGAAPKVPIDIEGGEEQGFAVRCPNPLHPTVQAVRAKRHYRAGFDLSTCQACPFKDGCPTKKERRPTKGVAVFRFKTEDALKQKRHKAIQKIPKERRTLRAAVENLMCRFRQGEKHTGKLRVAGRFNFEIYAFSMGIAINFKRIFRHLTHKNWLFPIFRASGPPRGVSCQRTFGWKILELSFFKYLVHI